MKEPPRVRRSRGFTLTELAVVFTIIALLLAVGERTCDVARRFGLSSGRIAQLRRELSETWWQFHGLDPNGQALEPAAA